MANTKKLGCGLAQVLGLTAKRPWKDVWDHDTDNPAVPIMHDAACFYTRMSVVLASTTLAAPLLACRQLDDSGCLARVRPCALQARRR